ncbi:MAG: YceD family protein [Suipraeoptans sp.]
MFLNLSDVLSDQHRSIIKDVPFEMDYFKSDFGKYKILNKDLLKIDLSHVDGSKIKLEAKLKLIIEAACDRCLDNVNLNFDININKEIDFSDEEEIEESNEIVREGGYVLDTDKLVYNELIVGWPAKVLCKDDCKGICNVCGRNQNTGVCDCEDTGLDPRMAAFRDVYKNFKEV